MGKFILAGEDEMVADWVADRVPEMEIGDSPYTAIGLVNDGGVLVGGVVYTNYTRTDIHMHIALTGRRVLTRWFIGECFRYPFVQLGVKRVTGLVAASNEAARRFDEHMGFKQEGVLRHYMPDGDDCIVYGMLREECRWLTAGVVKNGRRRSDKPGFIHGDTAGTEPAVVDAA
jgi:RimJ/RimL family protein N-acetyltransferase